MLIWIKQKYYGQPTDRERAYCLNAAIQYACSHETHDGLEWLRQWNEGNPLAMDKLDEYKARD